jgi:hypothetical protein
MHIAHFAPNLRTAIDPDDVLSVRHPTRTGARRGWPGGYHRSAPSVLVVAICSPPWRRGS